MLEGPARVWLNNQPAGSINCWLDFEDMFVSNFTSTYKRPNRPQQLAICKQRPNETDREFLTRWCNLRNSCERVIESQAIAWFAQGCRYASVLWQRLQRDMPTTWAETIRIADLMGICLPGYTQQDVFRLAQELASGPARRRLDRGPVWIQATGS